MGVGDAVGVAVGVGEGWLYVMVSWGGVALSFVAQLVSFELPCAIPKAKVPLVFTTFCTWNVTGPTFTAGGDVMLAPSAGAFAYVSVDSVHVPVVCFFMMGCTPEEFSAISTMRAPV